MSEIVRRLFDLRDDGYAAFQLRLIPTAAAETIIGVRVPQVRALAKELEGSADAADFMAELPHKYYDENMLHACLLSRLRDYSAALAATDAFLPYVDNWAVCDILSPKVFAKHTQELLPEIRRWMSSGKTYTVRFGTEMLMSFYLDARFQPKYLDMAAAVRSEEYYVNMMTAWFFATALAKQYDAALPYIQDRALDVWTHNKAIQKAVESYRITDEQKAYLKTLRIKTKRALPEEPRRRAAAVR